MKNFCCTAPFSLFTIFGFAKPIDKMSPLVSGFLTSWKTTAANESITIPVEGITQNINCGDKQSESLTNASQCIRNPGYTYAVAGTYAVTISGQYFYVNNITGGAVNAYKLKSVASWGSTAWSTMNNALSGCSNLVINATDAPYLTNLTDMSGMLMQLLSRYSRHCTF